MGETNKKLAPQVGLEPTTLRLTAGCSAIELLRSVVASVAEEQRVTAIDMISPASELSKRWRVFLNSQARQMVTAEPQRF